METRRSHLLFFGISAVTGLLQNAPAQNTASPSLIPVREQKILQSVQVPEGFDVTVFSCPPQSNYQVYAAAAPDGTVYVSSDKNGSLDRKGQRGSVLRLRDLNGDGRADEVKPFVADVDSPRGLVWDHDRVYLMHPPHLSAFIDHNGDGIADEQKVLVRDIAFGFKDRPADHTSNGVTLGIDGWLYLAIGDFGFMKATGTDGTQLQFRAGGVVRVRPDGTGLHVYSRGTRNILEVALSPDLQGFARDNTNDGGGWDMRFHHFTGLGEYGYPSLYMNFGEEIIQPIGNYGGGSGCGAAWLDEPGFPPGYRNVPLTVDWGKERVFRHELSPNGATWKDTAHPFLQIPRATDVDPDASSHLYATSFAGATFNYNGEDVGYVLRVTPKGYQADPLPDFASLSSTELIRVLQSPSHRRRLEAQRTLLRKHVNPDTLGQLSGLVRNTEAPLAARIAALFAVVQGWKESSIPLLQAQAGDSTLRPLAVQALGDQGWKLPAEAVEVLTRALQDPAPRVRLEAAVALARVQARDSAPALTALLADPDPVVLHTAVQALTTLRAVEACLAVIDVSGPPGAMRSGALRVLQRLTDKPVVIALTQRLQQENDPLRRKGLLTALCRLTSREGEWKGDSWGTRPDTTGPWYQPAPWEETPGIVGTLRETLAKASPEEAAFLLQEMGRHRIRDDAALARMLTLARSDTSLLPLALQQLERSEQIPPDALPVVLESATAPATPAEARFNAVRILARSDSASAPPALLQAMVLLADQKDAAKAREAFLDSPKLENHHTFYETAAAAEGPAAFWADAALLTLSSRKSGSPEARQLSRTALEQGWTNSARRTRILRAIALTKQRAWSDQVLSALQDTDPAVAAAAAEAAKVLKLDPAAAAGPKLADLPPETILKAVLAAKGDAAVGQQIFVQAGCGACHTVTKEEAQKGPFLGNIADTYKRPELAEAILEPNKTLAQGFVTNLFELTDGSTQLGFVTREAADQVVIRTVTAEEITLATKDIKKRDKLPMSLMPPGLLINFTARDFASLLDYLESLAKKE